MHVETFRNGGHRAVITTDHRGTWVKLKLSDGMATVEVTLKPDQVTKVIAALQRETEIATQLARAAAQREEESFTPAS